MENQILTDIQRTINHMIIFNDAISKVHQCSIRGFCRGIFTFFSICLNKKKMLSKILFCLKRKAMFRLIKSYFFVFHTIFKLDFITQIIYCILHRCMYFLLFSYYTFFSLVSVLQNIETMLTLGIQLAIVQQKKWTIKEATSIRAWTLNM